MNISDDGWKGMICRKLKSHQQGGWPFIRPFIGVTTPFISAGAHVEGEKELFN